MGLSDPFPTTYAGSYEAGTSLGKGLQKGAESFLEMQKKQADPLTMMLMQQMGLGKEGGLPKTAKAAQDKAVLEMGGKSEDYIPEPVYETLKGIKQIAGYEAKEDPNIKKLRLEAQKNLQTYTSNAHDVLYALEKVEAKAKKLPEFKPGIPNQLLASLQISLGETSATPEFTEYDAAVNSELIPLARKLQEEKGPITEWDVKRVEKGLGRKTLPLSQKQDILGESKKKVYSALRNKMDAAGMTEKEFANKFKTVYEKSKGLGKYIRFGKDEEGNRIGQLPDGTTELIYGD